MPLKFFLHCGGKLRFEFQIFALCNWLNLVNCLICYSDYCRRIDGCPAGEAKNAETIRCPNDASCFLRVKIQFENNSHLIAERAQGCTTLWDYMRSENGSASCFNGPDHGYKTCLCSDASLCNDQLNSVDEYRRLRLRDFPISTRKIDCIESGVIYSSQSYCTYRRSVGVDLAWSRRTHMSGYVSLLENSQRDHLCFRDGKEIDCYCKADRCNDNVPPPSILRPPLFIGAYDDKVTCCRGEMEEQFFLHSKPVQGPETVKRCVDDLRNVCTGDYCYIKFKYHSARKTIVGRQTCYNTSSELIFGHNFEGSEFGPYRERVLYCREHFCNQLSLVLDSISRGAKCTCYLFLISASVIVVEIMRLASSYQE